MPAGRPSLTQDAKLRQFPQFVVKYGTRQKALEKLGYSKSYARSGGIINTKGFKIAMATAIEKLEKERDRILDEMSSRDLDGERYKELGDTYDKLNKNIQLLGGKPTEITKHDLSSVSTEELRNLAFGEEGVSEKGTS